MVSERLGHSSVVITHDLYTHVMPATEQHAADAIAALVGSARGGHEEARRESSGGQEVDRRPSKRTHKTE